jgi:hypothetical protein
MVGIINNRNRTTACAYIKNQRHICKGMKKQIAAGKTLLFCNT